MALSLSNKIIVLIFLTTTIKGQDQQLLEEIMEQGFIDLEAPTIENQTINQLLVEDIKALDLNKANTTQLNSIPWLTPVQVQSLQRYIAQNGPLVSIYELQAVPGWDLATIRLIEPLVQVTETSLYHDPRNRSEKIRQDGGLEFMIRAKRRLELSRGYHITGGQAFRGSPMYLLSRFQYRKKGDLSFGITAEKDPGEKLLWDPSNKHFGADFLSMHILIENKGMLKRLVVGDFRAHWDQGLVLGSGLSLGKQVITGPRKVHRGLLPHTSAMENRFFRGIGMEIQIGSTTISSLYSRRLLDVQLLSEDSMVNLPIRVPSIIESGLHRTSTELDRRQQLPEETIALHIRQTWSKHLIFAISGVYREWKWPLIPVVNRYNTFHFRGNKNYNISGSMEYVWKNINTFGQFAISANGGWGGLIGLITSLSPKVSMTLHFRNYQKNFHGISGKAFGKRSGNINEQGIYWGFQVTPSSQWIAGLSANLYKFPGLTSRADGATQGFEHMVHCQYVPNKKSYVNLFWRIRTKQINAKPLLSKSTHDLIEETKHTFGISAKWQGETNFTIQSRLQYSQVLLNATKTQGMLASNQVSYDMNFIRFTLSMAIFNTENFENRQYIYERDFPHSLTIPLFDGIGTRWYCLTRFKITSQVDFWLRIAQTNYQNRDQIGSGPNTIDGSKRTDLSLQIRYKL